MSQHVIIIGGGPAGIEAARTVVARGGRASLISDQPIGGRAGWDSLLPSKIWLSAAEARDEARAAAVFGVANPAEVDAPAVLRRLAVARERWNEQQRAELEGLGVELLTGTASFVSPGEIEVEVGGARTRRVADRFVVASGSVPWFPDGLKPDGKRVLAPRFASHLQALPRSIVVIGGGATGCEYAYLFLALGARLTWIVDEFGVLPTFHPDAGQALAAAFVARGATVVEGRTAVGIDRSETGVAVTLAGGEQHKAEVAFVAIGRRPDWSRLNLAAAGIEPRDGRLALDSYGRTVNPAVYLVGDTDGGVMVANKAMAQARVAAQHALGLPTRPYDPERVLLAVYSEPQVAQVGRLAGQGVAVARVPYSAGLKPHLRGEMGGFVMLAADERDGRVTGALAVGARAAEVLAPVVVALHTSATVAQLAAAYAAHPTHAELLFLAARAFEEACGGL